MCPGGVLMPVLLIRQERHESSYWLYNYTLTLHCYIIQCSVQLITILGQVKVEDSIFRHAFPKCRGHV